MGVRFGWDKSRIFNGFLHHAIPPKIAVEIYKIERKIIEKLTAVSLLNPKRENKKIKVASRVPIPDIEIGIREIIFAIDIKNMIVKNEMLIPNDSAII